MKVKLIVVRGKPEGKEIPLSGNKFKIGRGETCHLRPNSEQVSREHAEFNINNGVVTVADLGSRNGTLVNGKALTEGPCVLKDRDLVQVGPLTFAVSIEGSQSPAAAIPVAPKPVEAGAAPASKAPAKPARSAPEDVLNEDIDAWLVGAPGGSNPEVPTTVYGGETLTIAAFKDTPETPAAPKPAPVPSAKVEDDDEEEEEDDDEEDEEDDEEELEDTLEEEDEEDEDEDEEDQPAEEFIDESNPFYAAKKAQQQASKAPPPGAGGANQQFKDTSDAAGEILRKLMEKRRASK